MDTGHFNCRDYEVPVDRRCNGLLIASDRGSCSSPMNRWIEKPKPFPLTRLPLELRQTIYLHLLPRATARGSNPLVLPSQRTQLRKLNRASLDLVWKRGQTSLLRVSRQLHDECAALLYGNNAFVLYVRYDSITFRHPILLPNGLAPSKQSEFLDLVPRKYLRLIKQLIITVDHPDSYTGMIKYNVGGKGLTHGLRKQVQKLVDALSPSDVDAAGLNSVNVTLTNGNKYLDSEKRSIVRARDHEFRDDDEVQTVLEPLAKLPRITTVKIQGAVTDTFANQLRDSMVRSR